MLHFWCGETPCGQAMIPLPYTYLALTGSPYQWAIAALIAIALFAPRLLPALARLLAAEIRRRAGANPGSVRRRVRRVEPVVQRPTARSGDFIPLTPQKPVAFWKPVIGAALFVGAAILLLLWSLLHAR